MPALLVPLPKGSMRYATAGLILALATGTAAEAQQTSIADPTLLQAIELPPLPEAIAEVKTIQSAPTHAPAVEIRRIDAEGRGAEPISARSVLAIIGALVVGVALVALFS